MSVKLQLLNTCSMYLLPFYDRLTIRNSDSIIAKIDLISQQTLSKGE